MCRNLCCLRCRLRDLAVLFLRRPPEVVTISQLLLEPGANTPNLCCRNIKPLALESHALFRSLNPTTRNHPIDRPQIAAACFGV